MRDYAVVLARSARKELEALEPPIVARVVGRLEALATNPRPPGARKLRGSRNLWRVRVGDYRIVYGWSTSFEFDTVVRRTKSNSPYLDSSTQRSNRD